MSKINDGGAAFPGGLWEPQYGGSNDREPYNDGMSLRDWFAGQALAGMSGSESYVNATISTMVQQAYEYADAMLAARGTAAAAPTAAINAELLEALEEIVEITDRDHVAWERAKIAIRKARGEQ